MSNTRPMTLRQRRATAMLTLARKRVSSLFTSGKIQLVDRIELELAAVWAGNLQRYIDKELARRNAVAALEEIRQASQAAS